ncbi:MAG: hypothetical protein U1C73_02650 [Dietzia sp.]|nr:hypothetical protein [Dietzia sp.]
MTDRGLTGTLVPPGLTGAAAVTDVAEPASRGATVPAIAGRGGGVVSSWGTATLAAAITPTVMTAVAAVVLGASAIAI